KGIGDFLHGQPAKIAEFDDARLPRIQLLESAQRLMYGEYLMRTIAGNQGDVVESDPDCLAATLGAQLSARMVHQNASHKLCGYGKKLAAALPLGMALRGQLDVGLMYQRGRLQGVVGTLLAQATRRQAVQFVVDSGSELDSSFFVVLSKPLK